MLALRAVSAPLLDAVMLVQLALTATSTTHLTVD
jgi:hypothetical protein